MPRPRARPGVRFAAPSQAPTAPTPDTAASLQEPDRAAPTLIEGRDYSFFHLVDGEPVRWDCAEAIPVTIEGPVPDGAQEALDAAVVTLADVTGLPLTTQPTPSRRRITVRYTDSHLDSTGQVAGDARTWWSGTTITKSDIRIRTHIPLTSRAGVGVVTHELAHALGLGHADQESGELMAPASMHRPADIATNDRLPDPADFLGPGDRHALSQIGC